MALDQIIQHKTGAYSSYWRVTRTLLDYEQQQASITLLGYVDESARQSNRANLDMKAFSVSANVFDEYFAVTELDQNTNPVKQAYLYIKTTSEFLNATDI